eukprot:TRINITY_DN34831_c0_g1_i1.p1 TRINITY_DN34831_c0_g1~~TRINITY_DN34831_c0_g1_i1.p1  ORF type:complete len:366 (-),score=69.41 TRINITY_DN34831_c0_g1_i1:92-1102(-)
MVAPRLLPILCMLCLSVPLAVSVDEALVLLQAHVNRKSMYRTSVDEKLANELGKQQPKSITSRTADMLNALKAQTQEFRKQAATHLAERTAEYNRKLATRNSEMIALKNRVEQLVDELNERRNANENLQHDAEHELQGCDRLQTVGRSMQKDLSSLEQNVADVEHEANKLLTNSPVLDVLAEQDALALARHQQEERQRMLAEVAAGHIARDVSLVQIDPARTQELIAALTASLDQVSRAETASLAEAERDFSEKSADIEAQKKALLTKQSKLSEEIAHEKALKTKLLDSISRLKEIHQRLEARNDGLRRYFQRLAGSTVAAAKVEATAQHERRISK